MAHKIVHLLLLPLGLLTSACSAPSTDRVKDGEPVKSIWIQGGGGGAHVQRLVMVNQAIDIRTDPSHIRKGEVSRLTNEAMKVYIAELEKMGFFDVARPTPPPGAQKYVSLHLRSGDYYVGMDKSSEKMARTYADAVKAFTAYWSLVGDTRFMTGSATGEAPVDFEKQKAEQERRNQERRNKHR